MKTQYTLTVLAIIGSVLVGTGASIHDAYAASYDELLEKMVNVNTKLADLEDSQNEVNELTLAKTAFELEQVKKSLLEINEKNIGQYDRLDKIYDYLKADYYETIDSYSDLVKEHENKNGLTFTERQLLSKINSNKMIFDMTESKQDYTKNHQELMVKEIEKVKAKKEYQKLVNKIGMDLADKANGNDVQKTHHKLAIKKVIDSKNWDMAIPAIDRVIKQVNDKESKQKLENIKQKVDVLLDKKRKVSNNQDVFALNNNKPEFVGPNFVGFGGILENQYISDQLFGSEIEALLDTSDIIITFDGIIESEIEESIKKVENITQEEEQEVEEKREQQRKHARENDRSKPDSTGKPDFDTGKPDNLGKPDAAGKPDNSGKSNDKGKPDSPGKKN